MTTPAAPRRLPAAVAVVVLVGVLVRLHSPSGLWLDEALSVNISRLPLHQMFDALRHDGSPPLYYLLLHGWMSVFGTSTNAVRALSGVFALAALPLMWLLGRRLGGRTTAEVAVLLLATSPFAVRYATETRMYAMVLLLALAGGLALLAALDNPTVPRLLGVGVSTGALLLTHYWALYLLTVVGAVLLWVSRRSLAARRCVAAMAVGALMFLPWLPSFLFQAAHTGTPWAAAPNGSAVLTTIGVWAGGVGTTGGGLLTVLLLGLVLVGVFGRRSDGGVLLSLPLVRRPSVLALVAIGTVALGVALAAITSAGFAPRYTSVAVGPFLLAAAIGAAVLPRQARHVVVTATVLAGLAGTLGQPFSHRRTQAPMLARAIRAGLAPGDLVVYCPDQTGPAVSRLLPRGTDQVVYPTLGRPERVDWVDYAQRNEKASPADFADRVLARSRGAIWLVSAGEHRTFGHQCEDLDALLTQRRGGRSLVVPEHRRFAEWAQLTRYAPG